MGLLEPLGIFINMAINENEYETDLKRAMARSEYLDPDAVLERGQLPPDEHEEERGRDERTHELMVKLRTVANDKIEKLEMEKVNLERNIETEQRTVKMAEAAIDIYQQIDKQRTKRDGAEKL